MEPNFRALYQKHESDMIVDAFNAITQCDLWHWIKTYNGDLSHRNFELIKSAMKFEGHSNFTYRWVMDAMKSSCRQGWIPYKKPIAHAKYQPFT